MGLRTLRSRATDRRTAPLDRVGAEAIVAAAQKVADAYGALLERGGVLRDLEELPYSKDTIKTSLRVLMKIYSNPELQAQLEVAYVSLATFQKMTATERTCLRNWDKLPANLNYYEGNELVKALTGIAPGVISALARSNAEMAELRRELQVLEAAR
jgi:hypothetical protein